MDVALENKDKRVVDILEKHGATYSEEFAEEWLEWLQLNDREAPYLVDAEMNDGDKTDEEPENDNDRYFIVPDEEFDEAPQNQGTQDSTQI